MTMLKPRLRPGVGAGIDEDGLLRLIFFSESRHVLFDAQPAVLDALRALEHGAERPELLSRVRARHERFGPEDLEEIIAALDEEGALEDAAEAADELEPEEAERFARQIGFFYDMTDGTRHPRRAQRALRESSAVVVGIGGTGTWVAQSLAMAGVGRLTLVDPDSVSRDNLTRQVLFGIDDVGRSKAEAAAARLRAIAGPGLTVRSVPVGLTASSNLAALIDGADLVVNCADEPDTNTTAGWIAAACMPHGIPHIVGGAYAGHVGLIGPTILPFETACWTCFVREAAGRNRADRVTPVFEHRTRHTGAIAPLSAIVANLQAWDAIRVLSGIDAPALTGRLGEFDLRSCELTWREVPRDPNCPDCGPQAAGRTLDRKHRDR